MNSTMVLGHSIREDGHPSEYLHTVVDVRLKRRDYDSKLFLLSVSAVNEAEWGRGIPWPCKRTVKNSKSG